MQTEVIEGHSTSRKSLTNAINEAIKNALQDASAPPQKLIVIITGIRVNDGKFEVDIECVMVEPELDNDPSNDNKLGTPKPENAPQDQLQQDFEDAEPTEVVAAGGINNPQDMLSYLDSEPEIYISESVQKDPNAAPYLFYGSMGADQHENLRAKHGYYPGANYTV